MITPTPLAQLSPIPQTHSHLTAVAMSGGVDSSAAAALLMSDRREIFGLTMVACDAHLPAAEAAAEVCRDLGILHVVVDLKAEFFEQVIQPFAADYLAGLTPSPCVHCNPQIKFGLLLQAARRLGAETLATGHYAQLTDAEGHRGLYEGADLRKDQSYFLFAVPPETLSAVEFPLGGMTKPEVRVYAEDRALPVAHTPDSEDICFVPDGDYVALVEQISGQPSVSGPVCDLSGRLLGQHRGQHRYTIGQRKGLGIASSERLYVVGKQGNRVILGPESAVYRSHLRATRCVWQLPQSEPFRARVRIRSTDRGTMATVTPGPGDAAEVAFEAHAHAVAPGQAAVFYIGHRVIGGGIIEAYDFEA